MNNLRSFFTTPVSKTSDYRSIFWFSLSLTLTVLYCIVPAKELLSNEYIIQDDARQHVFWMRRFLDPELFPHDLIADYLQSVAPYGFANLYHSIAFLGIDPVVFSKVLPFILIVITIIYCFGTCLKILPIPAAAFMATVFLNQSIWMVDDVASATPRAFLYPLFLAFLYYLLSRSLFPCLIVLVLQGLFYPQCLLICAGVLVLRLFRLEGWRVRFSKDSIDYRFGFWGLVVTALILLPYLLEKSQFGPVITAAEAKNLPIFQSRGRKAFFVRNLWDYWVCGRRSGIIPTDWCKYFPPPQAFMALCLPFLLHQTNRFPLSKEVSQNIIVFNQILVSSLGIFFLSHAVLFKLYLPSRYTKHSIRIIATIAGAIAIILILDAILQACQKHLLANWKGQLLPLVSIVTISVLVLAYPLLVSFPNPVYVIGNNASIYQFFAKQPKDIVIASVSEEADNISTFSRRSVLISSETVNPYHVGFYRQMEERTIDVMLAQYTPNITEIKRSIEKYGIDFFLVDKNAFNSNYITENSWLRQVNPLAKEAIDYLDRGNLPALAKLSKICSVLETKDIFVLDAKCLNKQQ